MLKTAHLMVLAFGALFAAPTCHAAPLASEANGRLNSHKCAVRVAKVRAECATLQVPLDRADPASTASLKLEVVVLKSRSATPAQDPALFLTGGPGSSALYFLNVLARSSLLADRDIIAVEQRGNGYSEPNLLCDGEGAKSAEELATKCFAEITRRGVPAQAFNITQSAHDLADLKIALGIESWNVIGTSFGTFWALHYARLHPDDIRAMVVDSPYPPQADPNEAWIGHLNGISAIFTACAAQVDCNDAYPNLRERFVAAMEGLATEPRKIGDASFGAKDLMELVYNVNFETGTALLVPRLIDAVLNSDFATVEKIAALDPYGVPKGFDMRKAYSIGLNIGMPCIDDAPFAGTSKERLELVETWPTALIKAAQDGVTLKSSLCGTYWKVDAADPVMNQPVASEIPALITVGALDPETPPALGEQMARTLRNATLVVRPNASHASLSRPDACMDRVLAAFLAAPEARPDISCIVAKQPRFSLPGAPVALGAL